MAVGLEKNSRSRNSQVRKPRPWFRRRLVRIAGIVLIAVVAAVLVLFLKYWPFTRGRIRESLEESFYGKIAFESFHTTVFPHPGAVVQNLTLRRSSSPTDPTPLVRVKRMTVVASYADLLFRPGYVGRIILDGLRVHIPAEGSTGSAEGTNSGGVRTRVGEVRANDAVLEVMRRHGAQPLKFEIHALQLASLSEGQPFAFELGMRIPLPPGEVHAHGTFGPWNRQDAGQTAASGKYSFTNANLGVFDGIAGTLWSEGEFSGMLGMLQATGNVEVPDFAVKRSKHAVPLKSQYQAIVNATDGDVQLQHVDSTIVQTRILARGSVARKKGEHGKTTAIDFTVQHGRIQDVLRMFVKAKRPPLDGVTDFKAHVVVPPGNAPFLKKVQLRADFGIGNGQFTTAATQQDIAKLSETGAGKKPQEDTGKAADSGKTANAHAAKTTGDPSQSDETGASGKKEVDPYPYDVVSELAGHVDLQGGTATFSEFSFSVPDAKATMHGTYNLISEKVDLHGTLRTTAKFSNTTSGVKSVLLKPFDAIFKRKHHPGAKVPVQLTGTYDNPHAGLEIIK